MVRIVKGLRQGRGSLAARLWRGLPRWRASPFPGVALAVLLSALLVGCGSPSQRPRLPPLAVPSASPPSSSGELPAGQGTAVLNLPPVAAKALGQLGAPYRLGGADPAGFDCSGLVQWAFAAAGVTVPRTTEEQFHWFQAVPREDLLPGDLVFFRLPQAHVGIYLGAGEFVHAPASGRTVERARLDSPWFILGFAGGGRAPLR